MGKITLIILIIFTSLGHSQSKECAKFREGTFKVTDPASKKVCIIKREGDTQTERLEESAEEYSFDIAWLDDCTYTLTPTAATIARKKEVADIGIMTVKITKTNEDSYVHKVTVSLNPKFRRVDEVFVIKN